MAKKNRAKKAEPPKKPKPGVWPDDVPILAAAHIVRNLNHAPDGRHDLAGWLETTFDCDAPTGHLFNPVYHAAEKQLMRVLRGHVGGKLALWQACEDRRISLEELAGIWNEAMAKLGYG